MNKKSSTAKNLKADEVAENPVLDNSESDNVDKIRDILFGNQMREFDRKYDRLEERIAGDFADLRKENANQFDSLQTFVESEIEILASKLAAEENARIEDVDSLESQLKKSVKQIDKKIADLNKIIENQSREINQKILKQSQDFHAEMNSQFESARKRMDSYKNELSSGKVDKSALAEMLNALALQINADDSK